MGVGAGVVGGELGAAEERAGAAAADDHDAGATGLADGRGGVAGGVGAVGGAAGDDQEAPIAALAARGAVAAEGGVQAGHALARTRHVERPGAAARAARGVVAPELAEAAEAGVPPKQLVDEDGGALGVGHQVRPATGPCQRDVEEAPLLGVPVRAARRGRQHESEERIFLVLRREAEACVPEVEDDHVVGLAALGGMDCAELEAQPAAATRGERALATAVAAEDEHGDWRAAGVFARFDVTQGVPKSAGGSIAGDEGDSAVAHAPGRA